MENNELHDLEMSVLDPLKLARREKVLREIRSEDLKLAVAEGKLMMVEQHRETLSEIITAIITGLDTLPDVLERKLALDGVIVDALRVEVDGFRDTLYDRLMELQDEEEPEVAPTPAKPLEMPSWMFPAAPVGVVDQFKESAKKERPRREKLKGRPTNAERLMAQLEQSNA
jgi:hypothetical protein